MSSSGVWLSGSSSGEVGYIQLGSANAKMVGGGGGSGSRIEVDQSGVLLSINGANDSFKLSTETIVIDGKSCKREKVINARTLLNSNAKLTFIKGLLIDDGLDDSLGNDASDVSIDTDLKVSGNIYAYPPDGSSLTKLGKLAFCDDFTKKIKVTLTGTTSIPSDSETVYVYINSSGGLSKTKYYSNIPSGATYTSVSASAGGGSKPVTLSHTFDVTLGPGGGDIELSN